MKRSLPTVLIVIILSAAGCGGNSATTNTNSAVKSPGALSTAQIIGRAISVCKHANARVAAANYTVHNQRELAQVAPLRAGQERATVAELRKLVSPASMAADWHRIIEYKTNLAEELTKIGQAASAHDGRGMRAALASSTSIAAQLFRVAQEHGLAACAPQTS